ncbi:GGDEF domain-containing protein [Iodobacter sp. HSC-16F04]|uniref:diguanylate cyclase n=1 Tax=Iodobacter violaceini TaxID=3044271 RepID=A0ABX0KUG8_9NEIS|nr:GGDEF domain-containing protein [Iodobacter violacea]NHQ87617.1 GGDEF domain-containing protein [Iodobacter violacea]
MPLKPFIMLDAMADLTSLDDRDALLISLGISLQEIFDLERVDFYHCRPGTEHSQAGWQIKKTLSLSNGEIQQAWQWRAQNTLNSDSDDFDPLLKSALSDLNTAESIHFRLVRTLKMNDQPHVLIDCQGKHLFKQTDLRALQGMTRIYENHLSLLKYSETDTLTGLLNRKTLERQFQKIMGLQEKMPAISIGDTPAEEDSNRRSQQEDDSYFLAVMDIDHFKRINDQFGHIYGDEVLLLIAQLMQASFRSGDYLFRFGGEEFVILMGPQGESNAFFAVERFREKVEQTTFPQVGQVTISIGFTRLLHSEVLSTVLGRADEALYQSKSNGRNKVTIAPVDALNLHHPVNGSIELF